MNIPYELGTIVGAGNQLISKTWSLQNKEQTEQEENSFNSELELDHGRVSKRRQGISVFTLSAKIHKLKCFQEIVRKCKSGKWSGYGLGRSKRKSQDWGKLEISNAVQSKE